MHLPNHREVFADDRSGPYHDILERNPLPAIVQPDHVVQLESTEVKPRAADQCAIRDRPSVDISIQGGDDVEVDIHRQPNDLLWFHDRLKIQWGL